ncbi:MAG: globin-coupled sensor protein [Hyphomicrobiales bacterium]|nr:globin-coupled sensor protein [Hyphomicrobiales bacterium]
MTNAPATDSASPLQLTERMDFVGLRRDQQAARLLAPLVDAHLPRALDVFYARVARIPHLSNVLSSAELVERNKRALAAHWSVIAQGAFDDAYAGRAYRIGATHARIGLSPRWYIGGYTLILEEMIRSLIASTVAASQGRGIIRRAPDMPQDSIDALVWLVKACLLDIDMATTAYFDTANAARDEQVAAALAAERKAVSDSIGAALARLAAKDLRSRIDDDLPQAYEPLQRNFNAAAEDLGAALGEVGAAAGLLSDAAAEIAGTASDLAGRTERQALSLKQTATAVNQVTSAVELNAQGAREADTLVSQARDEARSGAEIVGKAVAAMGRIEKSSQNIERIIGSIDEIAFQTNLLALNAGVEAARAGEAGRGFAVVASEVRALAQRSAAAAKEIKQLIAASSSEVAGGVVLVSDTGKALEGVAARVNDIAGLVAQIAQASGEQANALAQASAAVANMDQQTQQNAALAQHTTAASGRLREQSTSLAALVGDFALSGGRARPVRPAAPVAPAAGRAAPSPTPAPAAPARPARPVPQAKSAVVRAPRRAPPAKAAAAEDWSEF